MNLNSNPSSTAHDPAPRMQRRGRQAGFNLVELMVAVAIGGLLLTGALSIFVNNQQLQKATSSMSRLQEDARYAMDLLVYDLRMAGFVGCSDDSSMVTVSSTLPTASTNLLWNLAMPIEGIDQSMIGSTPPEDLAAMVEHYADPTRSRPWGSR